MSPFPPFSLFFVPENIPGFYIVGTFHTHPWNAGPSNADMGTTEQLGVPAFIVSKTGYRFYGYPKRRGGFTGNPATWPPP